MKIQATVARLLKKPEVIRFEDKDVTKLFLAVKSDKAGREDEKYNVNCYGKLGEFLVEHGTTGARLLLEDLKLSKNKTYKNLTVYKATLIDFNKDEDVAEFDHFQL